ncbi:cytosolic endo-beta-N-acetylglucosaminidase-like [Limulus polyphemus]|uniref:Cytosolic endo-beta-N-acetylglucosaminidase-like n=1 Tax=Limulus polyphemus TaxID=6850 RepID=A0ABM1BGR5_LIMPO|nr:cytosolic endo-beta-N-acetylglucosaminidase-like [Limulus polyphemus]
MGNPEANMAKLDGARFFSKIYLIKSYWQILMETGSKEKTAFVTSDGCYQFKQMPFRFCEGSESDDCYRFFHWASVDIFVYFSHHFVTIPPLSWITVCHNNGVSVLGTVITEHEDGIKLCDEILESQNTLSLLVTSLVSIARDHEFDGWLINIENKIKEENVSNLVTFLHCLTKEMHHHDPNSLVIWYDSVTKTGELDWQNELNDKNRIFFEACDGIYVNYTWKEENLNHTCQESGLRKSDVFMGVDVFGRGTLGGGGFNIDEPLKLIGDYNLSAAIFAPGWVQETLGKENFTENQYKFWGNVCDLLPLHGFVEFPLVTSFCQGFGQKMFRRGKVIKTQPWTNLSLQQPQPSFHGSLGSPGRCSVRIYTCDGFNGGGCLQFGGSPTNWNNLVFRIFVCKFPVSEDVLITYTYKSLVPSTISLYLQLTLMSSAGERCTVTIGAENKSDIHEAKKKKTENIIQRLSREELKNCTKFSDLPDETEEGWTTIFSVLSYLEFQSHTIEEIGVKIALPEKSVKPNLELLLGQIQLLSLPVDKAT